MVCSGGGRYEAVFRGEGCEVVVFRVDGLCKTSLRESRVMQLRLEVMCVGRLFSCTVIRIIFADSTSSAVGIPFVCTILGYQTGTQS